MQESMFFLFCRLLRLAIWITSGWVTSGYPVLECRNIAQRSWSVWWTRACSITSPRRTCAVLSRWSITSTGAHNSLFPATFHISSLFPLFDDIVLLSLGPVCSMASPHSNDSTTIWLNWIDDVVKAIAKTKVCPFVNSHNFASKIFHLPLRELMFFLKTWWCGRTRGWYGGCSRLVSRSSPTTWFNLGFTAHSLLLTKASTTTVWRLLCRSPPTTYRFDNLLFHLLFYLLIDVTSCLFCLLCLYLQARQTLEREFISLLVTGTDRRVDEVRTICNTALIF